MDRMEFCGMYPGVLADVAGLHARYYHEHWGLDQSFEIEVGRELCEFASTFDPCRDLFQSVRIGGNFGASLIVDGANVSGQGARLRWFIVSPGVVGRGLGRDLMGRAMEFMKEKGYPKAFLWTYEGLDAARSLYERFGFAVVIASKTRKWGRTLTMQKYERIF